MDLASRGQETMQLFPLKEKEKDEEKKLKKKPEKVIFQEVISD